MVNSNSRVSEGLSSILCDSSSSDANQTPEVYDGSDSYEDYYYDNDDDDKYEWLHYRYEYGYDYEYNYNITNAPDASVKESGSVMQHVVVFNPAEGVIVTGHPPRMSHVSIVNSSGNGLTFNAFLHGGFALDKCSIVGSKSTGIYFRSGASLTREYFYVDACNVEDNGKAGIYVSSNVNLVIRGSIFHRNQRGGIIHSGNCYHDRPIAQLAIFERNTISENGYYGLKSRGAVKLEISNSEFLINRLASNSTRATLDLYMFKHYGNLDIKIQNNTFIGNRNYFRYHASTGRHALSYTVAISAFYDYSFKVS